MSDHNKGRRLPPSVLTHDELEAIMVQAGTTFTGRRDAAALSLMYGSALRVSEALALRPCDVDLAKGTIRVLDGKGGVDRMAAIAPQARERVAVWLRVRSEAGFSPFEPLFLSRKGQSLRAAHLRRRLPQLAQAAGIEKRVHCHAARHSHAARLADAGWSLPEIASSLGHKRVSTTDAYLARVHGGQLASKMDGLKLG